LLGTVPSNPLRLTEEKLVSLTGHYEFKTECWPNHQMKFQGQVHTVAFYKNGHCMEWYENCTLKSEDEMINGFRDGWCKDFYAKRGPRLEGKFVKGTLCGNGTQFRPNGSKIYEGEYKDDKR
jgi:antitoxin component YwqK of YwqJK toxin-antitoxin module